jgi:hypothetical protein
MIVNNSEFPNLTHYFYVAQEMKQGTSKDVCSLLVLA